MIVNVNLEAVLEAALPAAHELSDAFGSAAYLEALGAALPDAGQWPQDFASQFAYLHRDRPAPKSSAVVSGQASGLQDRNLQVASAKAAATGGGEGTVPVAVASAEAVPVASAEATGGGEGSTHQLAAGSGAAGLAQPAERPLFVSKAARVMIKTSQKLADGAEQLLASAGPPRRDRRRQRGQSERREDPAAITLPGSDPAESVADDAAATAPAASDVPRSADPVSADPEAALLDTQIDSDEDQIDEDLRFPPGPGIPVSVGGHQEHVQAVGLREPQPSVSGVLQAVVQDSPYFPPSHGGFVLSAHQPSSRMSPLGQLGVRLSVLGQRGTTAAPAAEPAPDSYERPATTVQPAAAPLPPTSKRRAVTRVADPSQSYGITAYGTNAGVHGLALPRVAASDPPDSVDSRDAVAAAAERSAQPSGPALLLTVLGSSTGDSDPQASRPLPAPAAAAQPDPEPDVESLAGQRSPDDVQAAATAPTTPPGAAVASRPADQVPSGAPADPSQPAAAVVPKGQRVPTVPGAPPMHGPRFGGQRAMPRAPRPRAPTPSAAVVQSPKTPPLGPCGVAAPPMRAPMPPPRLTANAPGSASASAGQQLPPAPPPVLTSHNPQHASGGQRHGIQATDGPSRQDDGQRFADVLQTKGAPMWTGAGDGGQHAGYKIWVGDLPSFVKWHTLNDWLASDDVLNQLHPIDVSLSQNAGSRAKQCIITYNSADKASSAMNRLMRWWFACPASVEPRGWRWCAIRFMPPSSSS